jgi:hypothetical protein
MKSYGGPEGRRVVLDNGEDAANRIAGGLFAIAIF